MIVRLASLPGRSRLIVVPVSAGAVLVAVAVVAETAAAATRERGFLLEATVLHLVVAAIAVVLIPRLFRRAS